MIEKVYHNIYKIEIPLPNSPLKATNAYFIRGKGRNLLIDTGFNRSECLDAMKKGIQEIEFSMENTDLFITHIHADHSGLAGHLATPATNVYCGNYCAQALTDGNSSLLGYYQDYIQQSGLYDEGFSIDLSLHPGYKYASDKIPKVNVIKDGDEIEVGDFSFRCIDTTGHAPDHMCLYEPKHRLLFSGDHILGKTTPNNTIWDAPWAITYDYLGAYLRNLDKIAALEIEVALPGHRMILRDCHQRIEELKMHHQNRLGNILEILGKEKMNGVEVASKMKWDIRAKSWTEFPPEQKIFATGEALSHLTHLVFRDILVKEMCHGVVFYSVPSGRPRPHSHPDKQAQD
ncbi:MBL fold metallo-hydrolase [Candidatus Formimonas warabiya]|uniref:MBL fold metallo-hydrolase n=1 Tax=Formimonas warabiya TaxID=1761012 RepID=A0A3G1KYZ4_FORW1|nr:MBL fold metallo-hydrolase [Candidatus Formimonas warabiya]ATW27435.1 MBL fold metallo-hydrolase [Candidatus Formimonas warabiya]